MTVSGVVAAGLERGSAASEAAAVTRRARREGLTTQQCAYIQVHHNDGHALRTPLRLGLRQRSSSPINMMVSPCAASTSAGPAVTIPMRKTMSLALHWAASMPTATSRPKRGMADRFGRPPLVRRTRDLAVRGLSPEGWKTVLELALQGLCGAEERPSAARRVCRCCGLRLTLQGLRRQGWHPKRPARRDASDEPQLCRVPGRTSRPRRHSRCRLPGHTPSRCSRRWGDPRSTGRACNHELRRLATGPGASGPGRGALHDASCQTDHPPAGIEPVRLQQCRRQAPAGPWPPKSAAHAYRVALLAGPTTPGAGAGRA